MSDQICANCRERPGTVCWTGHEGVVGFIHGAFAWWCELCACREQLKHARERAAQIPVLEARLQSLMLAEEDRVRREGLCQTVIYEAGEPPRVCGKSRGHWKTGGVEDLALRAKAEASRRRRGHEDGRAGRPPSEASPPYLAGYIAGKLGEEL